MIEKNLGEIRKDTQVSKVTYESFFYSMKTLAETLGF
jgi:hypothetical protein